MIRLHVQEYCHNCPEFEPTVSTVSLDNMQYNIYEKTISCEHSNRCSAIYKDAYKKAYKEAKEKLCAKEKTTESTQ